ncbi:MAG TPA: hypothetical protein ENL03_03625 [Phycisphaerae bacterium]|nr:hypothetical protein [Phycisphaerae bacterium]
MKPAGRKITVCLLAIFVYLLFSIIAADQAFSQDDPLDGSKGSKGLFPINKIHSARAVESPVDFGQLKPGMKVPTLPHLFPITNPNMDSEGQTFDLNAAMLKKPTLIIFWRG